MNWLAHLYLSEPTPAARIGNLLPDFAPVASLTGLPPEFQRGIRLHHCIDAYTDCHAITRKSVNRFRPPLRRYGGILTDLFYDHFLARHWSDFSPQPLKDFTRDVYQSFDEVSAQIPPVARERFEQIRAADRLNSYGTIPGIADAVIRIGYRFKRPVDLRDSVYAFEDDYDLFAADFRAFFPDLQARVAEFLRNEPARR